MAKKSAGKTVTKVATDPKPPKSMKAQTTPKAIMPKAVGGKKVKLVKK